MTKAKHKLTELLPDDISYTDTINEAEKKNAISNAMEIYAKKIAIDFAEYCQLNGYTYLGKLNGLDEWRKPVRLGFEHKNTNQLYEIFKNKDL